MATAARILLLLIVLAPHVHAQAQTMPELAAALMVLGERCGEVDLADNIGARYSGSREFESEVRFRRPIEPVDQSPEACASVRKRADELGRLDEQADALPWPAGSGAGLDSHSFRKAYAVRAGAAAARVRLCGFEGLTDRLSTAFAANVDFQQAFLVIQQAGLDGGRRLPCAEVERRARQVVVIFQHLELPRTTDPPSGDVRIQCLLPGLRTTIPMAVGDCAERRGKAFETFTRVDEDYDPEMERE